VDDLAVVDDLTDSKRLEADGFVVVPDVVDGDQCTALADCVRALENDGAGSRALLDRSWCVELARQLKRSRRFVRCSPLIRWQCNARCLTRHQRRIGW
jgi:hypothetical protein